MPGHDLGQPILVCLSLQVSLLDEVASLVDVAKLIASFINDLSLEVVSNALNVVRDL